MKKAIASVKNLLKDLMKPVIIEIIKENKKDIKDYEKVKATFLYGIYEGSY